MLLLLNFFSISYPKIVLKYQYLVNLVPRFGFDFNRLKN